MPLYQAMNALKSNIPSSKESAQQFLDTLPTSVQEQLIAAVYLGREHIHSLQLRDDIEISRAQTEHIRQDEYAKILWEKADNLTVYLNKLDECARASNFDLNTL